MSIFKALSFIFFFTCDSFFFSLKRINVLFPVILLAKFLTRTARMWLEVIACLKKVSTYIAHFASEIAL